MQKSKWPLTWPKVWSGRQARRRGDKEIITHRGLSCPGSQGHGKPWVCVLLFPSQMQVLIINPLHTVIPTASVQQGKFILRCNQSAGSCSPTDLRFCLTSVSFPHSQSSLGRGLAPAHQVMGTAAGMGRRKEKGSSLLGGALQRMTGEKEACSPDLPRVAALFLGSVDSEEKERVSTRSC